MSHKVIEGNLNAKGLKFAILVSRFNSFVTERLLTGRLVLSGETSPFRLGTAEQPRIFWLDRFHEVFGRFLAESRWPRRAAFERGTALAAGGAVEEAEQVWLAAFGQEVVTADERLLGIDLDLERESRLVDVSIRLALARLYLDEGRLDDAARQLELASDRLGRQDRWRFERELLALEARLALRAGRADEAAQQLRRAVVRDRDMASAETAALLALASRLAGRQDEYLEACEEALDRGVDLGPLECPADG